MHEKESLENLRYHKRGLSLKKDCIMNMTVLHHEYKGGLQYDILWGKGVGVIQGVDLTYLFASPLFEHHMGSRHCTVAAVL